MEYEVLYFNDNGTAKVRMTINGRVLEQDFDIADLDTNVKQGVAVFQEELSNNVTAPIDESIIGEIVTLKAADLPTIVSARKA